MSAAETAMPPAWTRWRSLRDRLLADPRFQRWAVRFPPTRWIARRRARALFDLCAGFVYSQVLAACVELRLFDLLAEAPVTPAEAGRRLRLPEDAALRLLEAARSLDLAERRGRHRFGLGPLGAALRGNPGVTAMVAHHALLYADLADPVGLLRGEASARRLPAYWSYAGARATASEQDVTAYSALMAASQAMVAAEVLDAYPVGRHRCLLDVGGGDGAFLAFAAARAPDLRLVLFDLPPVAALARSRFEREGLAGRATAEAGDFRTDSLPRGADLIALVRVVHDHDDSTAFALLKAVRAALPDDGTLLLAEPMAGTPGAEPVGAAYFGFYLLAMGQGRPRTAGTLATMLRAAGFSRIALRPTSTPMVTRLIAARP